MKEQIDRIHFYHTNDLHSHFENWPQISRLLKTRQAKHKGDGEASYLFDIGDFVDRSHPFTEGTMGKGNVQLLNEAGYDAVTIGNNEGITLSKEMLDALYENAEFEVILCNLFEEDGSHPNWAVSSTIFVTEKGTRIGIIGATALYTDFYSKLGWKITPPRTELKRIAEIMIDKTDLIVCLSHMGQPDDELLAAECNEIDVIFGAHTHHLFHEGKLIDKTLLAATGKYGAFTGHVTLEFNVENKEIVHRSAVLYPSESLPVADEDIEHVNDLLAVGNKALEERVFYNPTLLPQRLFSEGPLSSFFGRALLEYTGADCALFNSGIFLTGLNKGWVTKKDLHGLLPHPINPCVIELDGAELMDIYALSLNKEWPKIHIKGLGFRGALMGAMIYERLYQNRHGQLFVGNKKVVVGGKYKLATLDMFTFGFFFPSLKHAEKEYFMPELIRDVVAYYGRKYYKESTTHS